MSKIVPGRTLGVNSTECSCLPTGAERCLSCQNDHRPPKRKSRPLQLLEDIYFSSQVFRSSSQCAGDGRD